MPTCSKLMAQGIRDCAFDCGSVGCTGLGTLVPSSMPEGGFISKIFDGDAVPMCSGTLCLIARCCVWRFAKQISFERTLGFTPIWGAHCCVAVKQHDVCAAFDVTSRAALGRRPSIPRADCPRCFLDATHRVWSGPWAHEALSAV